MARSFKRLDSTTVAANTDTALYTTPLATQAIVSTIVACNTGASDRTFRVAYVDSTNIADVTTDDYLLYDITVTANNSYIATIGITMAPQHTIMVRASHAEVVFNCYGEEIS